MITTVVSPSQLQAPPGSVLRIPATWQQYQQVANQRGDGSIPRLKYRHGELLLMFPLPVHGRDAHLLSQMVITMLDQQQREYDAFTPVTMDLPNETGIEPDYCFYIENWPSISGKERINWQQDPPPDLVIEVDVTSYSDVDDYLPYRVPEVWLWKKQALKIYQLQGESYSLSLSSRFFPNVPLLTLVQGCFHDAYERNTGFAIRNLRQGLL